MRRIWATAERLIPRAVVAATTVIAAAVTDPFSMGLYAWGVIAVTFLGTLTEWPLRQCGVALIDSDNGRKLLRDSAQWAAGLGALLILCALCAIAGLTTGHPVGAAFISLAPLILVPVAQCFAVEPTAVLQRVGLWAKISLSRALASILSIAIGIPITLATKNIIGASVTVAAAEFAYAIFSRLVALQHESASTAPLGESNQEAVANFGKTLRHTAAFAAISWLQGHADRGMLGAWAGTTALGIYSLGSAMGRSAGEAISASQLSILRVDLIANRARSDEEIRAILGRHLRSALILSMVGAVATLMLAHVLLRPLLGPQWNEAFQIVPILVLTSFPLTIAASSTAVHIQRNKSKILFVAPTICLAFAPAIALAAITSLESAAWIYLSRECALAAIQIFFMGRATPWREVRVAVAMVGFGTLLAISGFLN